MTLFRELINNSTNKDNLQFFILNNIERFHDLYNAHYNVITKEKNDIRDFIEERRSRSLLEQLDYSHSQTKAFISILFDFCERFGFISTVGIENTLRKKDLHLGKRREAAKLFLLNIREDQHYIDRFNDICKLIQCSIETEEDNEKKSIVTFLNYLSKIIRDTSEHYISEVKGKIREHISNASFTFLNHEIIYQVCAVDTSDVYLANTQIQGIIEQYLGHSIALQPDLEEAIEKLLIEHDSDYYNQIINIPMSFENIRNIATNRCRNISNNLNGRGVNPLKSETELFIYLKRYGNMHKSKILSALKVFPFQNINNQIEIIDWGCGQGLATLVFLEYIKENQIDLDIKQIILIEPSEICLKRAALHINLLNKKVEIKTICNVFNNLADEDLITNNESIKIHLFSNVLDIDESIFLQSNIINLIEQSQKGINYFVCISPYINDEKADRVDAFKRHFKNKYINSYEKIFEKSNSGRLEDAYWLCNNIHYNANGNHGDFRYCNEIRSEQGCNNKWTRVIRVFKVVL